VLKEMVQSSLNGNKRENLIGNNRTLHSDHVDEIRFWKIIPDPFPNRQAKNRIPRPLQPFIRRNIGIPGTGMRKRFFKQLSSPHGCVSSCSSNSVPQLSVTNDRRFDPSSSSIQFGWLLPWYRNLKLVSHGKRSIVTKLKIHQTEDRFNHIGKNLGVAFYSRWE
jgi:hypothetical protein